MKQSTLEILNIKGDLFPWRKAVNVTATTNVNTLALVGVTISGVLITTTTRVLVTAQTNPIENGVYVNNARDIDFTDNDLPAGAIFLDLNTDKFWISTNLDTDTIGVSAITFSLLNISNFIVGTPTTGQSIIYNGTSWVPTTRNFGELSQATNYTLALPTVNVFVGLAPTSTTFNSFGATTNPGSGLLRYGVTDLAQVEYTFSVSIGTANQNLEFAIFVGGVQSTATVATQRMVATTDIQVIFLNKIISLSAASNVQIFARNTTGSGTTITIRNYLFKITPI